MANDTNFYSNYDRTVYKSVSAPEKIPADTLMSSNIGATLSFEIGHHLIIDFGTSKKTTHLFFKQTHLRSVDIRGTDILTHITSGTGTPEVITIPAADDNKRKVYTLATALQGRYVGITPKTLATSPTNAIFDIAIAMENLVEFPDGAWKDINPSWEHRTQGHHQLLSGKKVRFLGLGIPKFKIQLMADLLAYDHVRDVENFTNPVTDPLGSEDVKKLEEVFLYHRHFVFSDSIDNHPDRIFVASFDDNNFELPFSNDWKDQGHNVSVTVCEV